MRPLWTRLFTAVAAETILHGASADTKMHRQYANKSSTHNLRRTKQMLYTEYWKWKIEKWPHAEYSQLKQIPTQGCYGTDIILHLQYKNNPSLSWSLFALQTTNAFGLCGHVLHDTLSRVSSERFLEIAASGHSPKQKKETEIHIKMALLCIRWFTFVFHLPSVINKLI